MSVYDNNGSYNHMMFVTAVAYSCLVRIILQNCYLL